MKENFLEKSRFKGSGSGDGRTSMGDEPNEGEKADRKRSDR